jgi:hypothetical protein
VSEGRSFLHRWKYELLLAALVQHLFIAALIPDLMFYTRWVWPLNMVLLGFLCVGVFADHSPAQRALKHALHAAVVLLPAGPILYCPVPALMIGLSLCYSAFFIVIGAAVLRYLLRPSYISIDIVLAAMCGYLLLLESSVFLMQGLWYAVPGSFRGLDESSFTSTYLDLVYFCSITLTSTGFGDVTPSHHITKLAVSMMSVLGNFYSVIWMGVLISKYTANAAQPLTQGDPPIDEVKR